MADIFLLNKYWTVQGSMSTKFVSQSKASVFTYSNITFGRVGFGGSAETTKCEPQHTRPGASLNEGYLLGLGGSSSHSQFAGGSSHLLNINCPVVPCCPGLKTIQNLITEIFSNHLSEFTLLCCPLTLMLLEHLYTSSI